MGKRSLVANFATYHGYQNGYSSRRDADSTEAVDRDNQATCTAARKNSSSRLHEMSRVR